VIDQLIQQLMARLNTAQQPQAPSPQLPMAFGAPGMGNPFQLGKPTGLPAQFQQGSMFSSPEAMQWLQSLFAGGMGGMNSGGQGARGPAPNPFAGLNRFSGPFGNGGGPIAPGMGGGPSHGFGMGIRRMY
jgi:hypothetical protein